MDKCTNEQFWAVATLSGMNGFALAQHKKLLGLVPVWALLAFVTIATAYGVWFIIGRHRTYYFYRKELANLLQDENVAPEFLKKVPPAWRPNTLSGVVFYIGWVVSLWLFTFLATVN